MDAMDRTRQVSMDAPQTSLIPSIICARCNFYMESGQPAWYVRNVVLLMGKQAGYLLAGRMSHAVQCRFPGALDLNMQ